ncbi:IS1-like element transposase [Photorhabdus namnaonensis]
MGAFETQHFIASITARVLKIGINTVLRALKKSHQGK